jgi:pimeloyl-ACP methyl ester carboxylesterase
MRLALSDLGQGPVVVLLHGFPFDRSMWTALIDALRSTCRVIAPDLRGHGESDAPEGVYTMDAMADDVVETLDELRVSEPVVLGVHSMGGYVALSAVLRYPDRFRALLLIDTRAGADTPEAARNRETAALQVEATGKTDAVIEAMVPKLFAPSTLERRPELIASYRALMEKARPRAIVGALRGMAARPDRTADLPRIRVPSLVVVGADDVITTPAEARKIADSLPNARLAIIPESGHMAPVENPTACNQEILSFLRGLAGEGRSTKET